MTFDQRVRQDIDYQELTRLCQVLTISDRAELEAVAETPPTEGGGK